MIKGIKSIKKEENVTNSSYFKLILILRLQKLSLKQWLLRSLSTQ